MGYIPTKPVRARSTIVGYDQRKRVYQSADGTEFGELETDVSWYEPIPPTKPKRVPIRERQDFIDWCWRMSDRAERLDLWLEKVFHIR